MFNKVPKSSNQLGTTAILLVLLLIGVSSIVLYSQIQKTPDRDLDTEVKAPSTDYKAVTIKELIADPTKYDEQKIMVRGKYKKVDRVVVLCEPGKDIVENPKILEEYVTYYSTWVISSKEGDIAVTVETEDGVGISSPPNYKEGEKIEIKGILKNTTVASACDRSIRRRSIYIEVRAKDIDITLRPTPTFGKPIDQ